MADEKCPYCSGSVIRTDTTCPHCKRSLTRAAADQTRLPATMPSSTILLVGLGVVFAGLGVLMLSEATRGVGLICAGCFAGVWARVIQAGAHHHNVLRALAERATP